ncbi:MAG: polynucleotide adenylyltransferase PcnB [Pseudomonadota bacterium]
MGHDTHEETVVPTSAGTLADAGPASRALPEIPEDRLDSDALSVIHRLRSFGHQAYLVGGCVRDLLLGRQPKDFDVATSAHPGEIRAIFRNCRLIGRRFRLAHVYFRDGKIVETATFRTNPRIEGEAQDLLITRDNAFGTAEEDAQRRDFTVNGLFYDVVLGKVLDYVGGKADLERRILRTIGDPDVRIQEDPVRLLRAVRLAAKLGFEIEKETWDALVRHKGGLARCAPARVLEEVFRLLRSGHARTCLDLLLRLEALDILLPPLARHLRQSGPEAVEAFLTSLGRLDEIVQAGHLPDDSVLLAALLVTLAVEEERQRQARRQETTAAPAASAADAGSEEEAADAGEESEESVSEESAEAAPEEPAAEAEEAEEAAEEVPEIGEPVAIPWAVSAAAASVEEFLRELSRTARLPRRISERARTLLSTFRGLLGKRRRRTSPLRIVRQNHFPDALLVLWLWSQGTGEARDRVEQWVERARTAGVRLAWLEALEGEPPEIEEVKTAAPVEKGEAKRASAEEKLPPEAERKPPPGPIDFLPF